MKGTYIHIGTHFITSTISWICICLSKHIGTNMNKTVDLPTSPSNLNHFT